MRNSALRFEFVELVPGEPEAGTLYISIPFITAIHRSSSGCGREVVTPIAPGGWSLLFDGETVSLDPSIGNWSFPCQSHYWIRGSRVEWAPRWSRLEIESARAAERLARERADTSAEAGGPMAAEPIAAGSPPKSWWTRLRKWFPRW